MYGEGQKPIRDKFKRQAAATKQKKGKKKTKGKKGAGKKSEGR